MSSSTVTVNQPLTCGTPNFLAQKVKAHRTDAELAQLSTWDRWLSAGNEAADAAAKAACQQIPDFIRQAAHQVAHQSATE